MTRPLLSFLLIRLVTLPCAFIPYSWIHHIGKGLGSLSYYLCKEFRKRSLSNLALAIHPSEERLKRLAKKSMQSLMITLLEYPKLAREKKIERIAHCKNPEQAEKLLSQGEGVIFFCGHQANWELLFLEGTTRMPGVAIGRPIQNKYLYHWILRIRQKNGGTIITPKNAIREGLRALKKGAFLGLVSDQGMPDSGFSSLFFNKRAWTSPIAALLAYRTGRPILVATTRREKNQYIITYSDPIWPNKEIPQEIEVPRLMQLSLSLLEKSIREKPEEWMWQHNRWKQQTLNTIKKAYRKDSILIVLPQDKEQFSRIKKDLSIFREIYPLEFITCFVPQEFAEEIDLKDCEIKTYEKEKELFVKDYRFKLVFNLTDHKKLNKHFLKLAATTALSIDHFTPEALKKEVYRPLYSL